MRIHKSFIFTLGIFLLFYSYVFAPQYRFYVIINSGVFSVLIVILICAYRLQYITSKYFYYCSPFLFIGAYSEFIASLYGVESNGLLGVMCKVCIYIIFGYFIAYLIGIKSDSVRGDFVLIIKMYVVAVFLNSIIILLEFIYDPIRVFIETKVLYQDYSLGGLNYLTHPFRFRGISSGGGASLSVSHAFGLWFITALYYNKYLSMKKAIIGSFTIWASIVFLGRTGLIFGSIFLLLFIFRIIFISLRKGGLKNISQ